MQTRQEPLTIEQETISHFTVNQDQYFTIHEENGMFAICLHDKTITDAILAGDPVFSTHEDAQNALLNMIELKENLPGLELSDIYGMPNTEYSLQ